MSDRDTVDAGDAGLGPNRLTVNDPRHLAMLCGDPADPQALRTDTLRIDTAEGWVELTGDGTGGVVVKLIDAPEGHTDE